MADETLDSIYIYMLSYMSKTLTYEFEKLINKLYTVCCYNAHYWFYSCTGRVYIVLKS